MTSFWIGFFAIVRKEITGLVRDSSLLRWLILAQILDFAAVSGIDLTVRNLPAVVVDQDHSDESRELIQRIAATNTFDLRYSTTSIDQARNHIRAGRARAAVVIPADYGRTRLSQAPAHIMTLLDGSDSAASNQAAASIDGVAAKMNLEAEQELVASTPTVSLRTVLLFNPQGSTSSFMVPGLIAVLLAELYVYLGMLSIANERDDGNLERLLMTPMSSSSLIIGKMTPWFILAVLNGILHLLVLRFGFGVPIRGDMLVLIGSMSLYVLTCIALGAYIATGGEQGADAQTWMIYLFFPVMWLSGYVFPLSSVPRPFLLISYALPQTHFIEVMRGMCLRGASARDLAPHLVYLAAAPVVLTAASIRRFTNSVMD